LTVRLFYEIDEIVGGWEGGREAEGHGIQIGEMKDLGPVLRTMLSFLL
jgi:hypothetical protein